MPSLFLTPQLRHKLKKPLGALYPKRTALARLKTGVPVIAVGDAATEAMLQECRIPWIAVVDFKTHRRAITQKGKACILGYKAATVRVSNPAGTLSQAARMAVGTLLSSRNRSRLIVRGEEDLLVLPLMAHAPNGSVIYYGQPGQGGVLIHMTSAARAKARALLSQFSKVKPAA